MKNPWKSCHPLFRVHRVLGIQNDRLDLTNNEFLTIWKTQHHSQRYLQNKWRKIIKEVQISLDTVYYFQSFQQEWPKDWASYFAYHKPYELNKMGDNFFMDFSFFAHRFIKENIWIFFSQIPDALGVCRTLCKVKKEENLFWG